MRSPDLTATLLHEFERCTTSFNLFVVVYGQLRSRPSDVRVKLSAYNSYVDFISHLYEFYLVFIKDRALSSGSPVVNAINDILVFEVEKLLRHKREKIARGHAPSWENHISNYEVKVPADFGHLLRRIRNLRSHADSRRTQFDLAGFYNRNHRFVYLLYESAQWLWAADHIRSHNWGEIERFSEVLTSSKH